MSWNKLISAAIAVALLAGQAAASIAPTPYDTAAAPNAAAATVEKAAASNAALAELNEAKANVEIAISAYNMARDKYINAQQAAQSEFLQLIQVADGVYQAHANDTPPPKIELPDFESPTGPVEPLPPADSVPPVVVPPLEPQPVTPEPAPAE